MATSRLRIILAAGVVGLVVVVIVAWWLISPLFVDRVVDEAFPFELPSQEEMAEMSDIELTEMETEFEDAMPSTETLASMSSEQQDMVQERVMTAAAVMPDHEMDEEMPAMEEPAAILAGSFRGADDFHRGEGMASIFALPDGSHVLRLADFMVTNGPALSVLLSTTPAPANSDELGEYLDVGALKGNIGNQNYEIPAGTDLTQYASVVIYCVPFHVVFATASLSG